MQPRIQVLLRSSQPSKLQQLRQHLQQGQQQAAQLLQAGCRPCCQP